MIQPGLPSNCFVINISCSDQDRFRDDRTTCKSVYTPGNETVDEVAHGTAAGAADEAIYPYCWSCSIWMKLSRFRPMGNGYNH